MIRFLVILLVVLLVPVAAWLLLRRARHPEGPLTVFDVRRLKERSRRSPRLEAALVLRVSIAEEAEKAGLPDPTPSVDPAIRALERQEDLLLHLEQALAETSRTELQSALDDAKVERELAQTTELVAQKQAQVDGLVARLDQLTRLEARQQELREAADRLIFGIRGLHLALLDRASQEAAGADPLTDARAALEQTRLHTPRIDDAEVAAWSQKNS